MIDSTRSFLDEIRHFSISIEERLSDPILSFKIKYEVISSWSINDYTSPLPELDPARLCCGLWAKTLGQ